MVEYVGNAPPSGSSEVPHGNTIQREGTDVITPYIQHDKNIMEDAEEMLENGSSNRKVFMTKRNVAKPTQGMMKMKTVKYLARKVKNKVKLETKARGKPLNLADEIDIIVKELNKNKKYFVQRVTFSNGDDPPVIILGEKWQMDAIKRHCISGDGRRVNVLGIGKLLMVTMHSNHIFPKYNANLSISYFAFRPHF